MVDSRVWMAPEPRFVRRHRAVVGAILLSALVTLSAFGDGPFFLGLGDLPGGDFSSTGWDVSADGTTVVGGGRSENGTEAMRWTAESGMVGLGVLPGDHYTSIAYDVSGSGSVVVGWSMVGSGQQEAFRWTAAEQMVGLGDLPGGFFDSAAYGISADGSVIVGWSSSANSGIWMEAFAWTESDGMVGLGDLPGGGFYSGARAASPDGTTIVGFGRSHYDAEAFRWGADTGMVGLGVLEGGHYSYAENVSADGAVIVGDSYSSLGRQAFRWTAEEGMVGLGDLPGGDFRSFARDVSADGSVVVGLSHTRHADLGNEAFIYDQAHGMRNLRDVLVDEFGLDLVGWRLLSAQGISADGETIVGFATNPEGNHEAWIAQIPEPGTLVLLIAALALPAARRRSPRVCDHC